VLLEVGGRRLLTDPVLGHWVGPLHRYVAPVPARTVEMLDGVLLSHAHADHLDLRSLRRIGSGVPIVAPAPVVHVLRRHGIESVREVSVGSAVNVAGLTVTVVRADHDGRRWPWVQERDAVGFVVEGDPSVYFAGDTDLFPEMAELQGRVDVALLPVAGWGPTLPAGHLDPERAAEAAATIRPRVAIPIHWGTLAPPILRRPAVDPGREFEAAVAHRAPDVEVRVLVPGESTRIGAAGGAGTPGRRMQPQ
jgi:L-ascorbate metabolism protein UlaG (beta-lactamase superfamily)